jgi:hypothetical protein
MRAAFRISVVALVLSVGAVAHAQDGAAEPTPAQVRVAAEAFDKGREAYKGEDYVEAAEQFEKADSNAPSPAAIELAVRSRDKAGELDRAATLASLALKRYPDDQNLLKLAGDLAKRANATLFELTATCDIPCDLTVGGKIVHGAPDTQRMLYVQPGALTVRAGWADNRNDSKQITAEAGGKGEVTFTAPTTPQAATMAKEPDDIVAPEPTTPSSDKDDGSKKSAGLSPTVFFVGVGLTVVVGGVLVWSGIDTLNNPGADAVKASCDAGKPDCKTLFDKGRSNQLRTNVLGVSTAIVGVATILVGALATDWSGGKAALEKEKSAKRLRPHVDVTPWASLDGGGLQAIGRF